MAISVHQPPKVLPGYPDAQRVKPKTPYPGGLRIRWRFKGGYLEWDSQHGTLEQYSARGVHQGEFTVDGQRLKPADPTRRIQP